jgi:hypothetical protein
MSNLVELGFILTFPATQTAILYGEAMTTTHFKNTTAMSTSDCTHMTARNTVLPRQMGQSLGSMAAGGCKMCQFAGTQDDATTQTGWF